jgi:succinate dehydrogenase / fumarate reductase membrane anchor subunit
MNNSTKKWLILKYSSAIFLPLMFWFIINFISVYDSNYSDVVDFFRRKSTLILYSFFIIFAYLFSSLTISEVFEDYIHDEKIKNVANKVLNIFAIIVPLITIIIIFNLN